ncbi:MAG: TolB family protein [Terriglobales bacterium]
MNAIFLGSLDSEQRRMIVEASANAAYAAPGYLLFYRDKALMAQPFDLRRFALTGEPTTIASDVQFLPQVDRAVFTVSDSGVLIVQGVSRAAQSQLLWFDRSGKQVGSLGKPAMYGNVALAPDGKRVAYDITDLDSLNIDLWTMDLARGTAQRFTFDPAIDETPVWSPDGRQLLFGSNRSLAVDLFIRNSDGSGEDKLILHVGGTTNNPPTDWSRDGRYILYQRETELWYLTLPGLQTKPFLQTRSVVTNGQFSPDGHWVAYASNETGRWEVYVASFPEPRGKWQVSSGGGQQPRWRGDGKELFYLSPEGKMMAVQVQTGNTFDAGTPIALFQARPHKQIAALDLFTYDVSRDGQRFLINTQVEHPEASPMSVILNWTAELRK